MRIRFVHGGSFGVGAVLVVLVLAWSGMRIRAAHGGSVCVGRKRGVSLWAAHCGSCSIGQEGGVTIRAFSMVAISTLARRSM